MSAMAKPAIRNVHPLFLLSVMRNGTDDRVEATTVPKPRVTRSVGNAQQSSVPVEVNSDKIAVPSLFSFAIVFLVIFSLMGVLMKGRISNAMEGTLTGLKHHIETGEIITGDVIKSVKSTASKQALN